MINRRNIKRIYFTTMRKVKDFLLSDKSREFLIFLFFFFVASGFWLLQTLNNDYETEFSIPVRLKGVPDDVVITSEPPSELYIRVKDKGTVLLNYMLGKSFFPLTLPVRLQGTVSAGRQYYISDTICTPDSVLVYAPKGVLDTINVAYTQPVKFEDISDTLKRQIALLGQKGVKFSPSSVEMVFPVDIYTEKTVEVPLQGVNFPGGKVLRVFPSKVNVTFQVGLSRFRQISADDFRIYVSYEELLKLGSDKYTVKLKSLPKGVNQIRITPEQVDFLIEQVSSEYGN